MKILFLTAYSSPEHAASNYLGQNRNKALADAGFEMVVYTPTPCRGISKEMRREYKKPNKRTELFYGGKMVVHRFSLFAEGKNPLLRALRYAISAVKHYYYGIRAKEVDILFVSSTPPIQGAVAALVKKKKKIPFVYNLQDIFPDSLVGTGLTRKDSLLWKIGRVIEDFTYRSADKIIVISEDFKRNILSKGVPEEKIEVIYNWVDEKAVVDVPRAENPLFDKYCLSRNKFYVTYCGNIGLTQNMDLLLEVAKELETEAPEVQFVLVGEGAYKQQVVERMTREGIENVTLLPFQPYEDISYVFSLGNVGLVISKPGVGANSVPSKMWSILSASRPVLANFDENELKTIIEQNGCGVFTKAGDKETFKQAILHLQAHPEQCKEMGQRGRLFIIENLTRAIGTKRYVEVIRGVVENKKQIIKESIIR